MDGTIYNCKFIMEIVTKALGNYGVKKHIAAALKTPATEKSQSEVLKSPKGFTSHMHFQAAEHNKL